MLAAKAEVNLVMLSAGSTQGVKPGNHFRALHCGKFVGTVQVDKVWPDMCSARVILQPKSEEGFPIKKGDSAVPLTEPEPQAFKTKVIAISADKDKVTLAAGSKDVALRSCFGILHDNMVIAFAVVQGIGADTCSAKLLPMNSDKIVVGDGAICVDELNTWEHGFLLERILQSAAEKTGSK
ncbi:MAG TPA: hypothetical protein VKX17_11025 [Planctomycetota bacterium]|nr:hypothetical protein [Planctomycetota bacterium]